MVVTNLNHLTGHDQCLGVADLPVRSVTGAATPPRGGVEG